MEATTQERYDQFAEVVKQTPSGSLEKLGIELDENGIPKPPFLKNREPHIPSIEEIQMALDVAEQGASLFLQASRGMITPDIAILGGIKATLMWVLGFNNESVPDAINEAGQKIIDMGFAMTPKDKLFGVVKEHYNPEVWMSQAYDIMKATAETQEDFDLMTSPLHDLVSGLATRFGLSLYSMLSGKDMEGEEREAFRLHTMQEFKDYLEAHREIQNNSDPETVTVFDAAEMTYCTLHWAFKLSSMHKDGRDPGNPAFYLAELELQDYPEKVKKDFADACTETVEMFAGIRAGNKDSTNVPITFSKPRNGEEYKC